MDVLEAGRQGIGWPPHRISLRLAARLLRLPLKGEVIANAWERGRDARAPSKPSSHDILPSV